jgi:methionine synthase I (cobalamin-dependent)
MSTSSWSFLLGREGPVITDGGWGTQFGLRGLKSGEAPEAWNLSRSADVEAVARSYAGAGSEIILTNTFGATALKLKRSGISDDPARINRAGVELSRRGAGTGVLVFADIGPTGELLEPYGDLTEADAFAQFRAQAESLLSAGPDGFVIETMTDLNEAVIALRAVRSVVRDLPVVVSMTYQKVPGGYATMMGHRPDQVVPVLDAEGVSVVGTNCGAGLEEMIGVASVLSSLAKYPVWVKPNAGLPVLEDGRTVYRETPAKMAEGFPRLVSAGAKLIGGCCGTTPDHIRSLISIRARLFQ